MRRSRSRALTAAIGAFGFLLTSGCATSSGSEPKPVAETVLDAQSDFVVDAVIKGRPVRLKVDPGAPWYVLLNAKVAKELRLIGTKSATLAVGPMRVKGKTRSEQITFGTTTARRPIMWLPGQSVADADGVINPANLPWDRVTMRHQAPRGQEQRIELPMRFDRERGLYYEYPFGGQVILTRFTLADTLTTTTAAAASVFAKRHQGLWDGPLRSHPVRYGVIRPVRSMILSQPLSLNGFTLARFGVRVSDDRGTYKLPEQQVPTQEDEDSIIVLGKQPHIGGTAHFWLMVGSDHLNRCSSISYDNKSSRLILTCSSAGT